MRLLCCFMCMICVVFSAVSRRQPLLYRGPVPCNPYLRAVLPCPPPCQNSVERFTRNPRVRDFTRIRVKIGGGVGAGEGGGTGQDPCLGPLC